MALEVEVHGFLEGGVLRQPARGSNIIRDGEVEIGVGLPLPELLYGANIIGAVVAFEFQGFGFAVGELDRGEAGFVPGFREDKKKEDRLDKTDALSRS